MATNALTTKPRTNISQLAREHGVARSTIRRRLARLDAAGRRRHRSLRVQEPP
jgi:transposase-like protein